MSRFHCIHSFAKTQFRDEPVGTSPGIIGLFTIFRTILVEPQSLQIETCGFCWDLSGDAIRRFSLFELTETRAKVSAEAEHTDHSVS